MVLKEAKANNMSVSIKIMPLSKEQFNEYIQVGTKSYTQHYQDFWIGGDSSPYINDSFTYEVLKTEFEDQNSEHFVIYSEELPVGILKIIPNQNVADFSKEEALLLEKIYILKEHSAKGIGTEVLGFVENFAKKKKKKVVWLDAMVKGRATPFYQKNGYKIISEKLVGYANIQANKRGMYVMVKKL